MNIIKDTIKNHIPKIYFCSLENSQLPMLNSIFQCSRVKFEHKLFSKIRQNKIFSDLTNLSKTQEIFQRKTN